MSKRIINLIGGGFQHSVSTNDIEPKYIVWAKNTFVSDVTMYVDNGLMVRPNPQTKNYGWLCESKTIIPKFYNLVSNNIKYFEDNFIKIFTHDVSLSELSNVFQLTQCSAKSYFPYGEVYDKTKLVSMITSDTILCKEHLYRHSIKQKFINQCDHFGRGSNPVENKVDALKDYCFSIVMENATYANMFTEKITDCFMTGTIPVYYGINNIGDFFDTNGIITLTDEFKIEDLSFELYKSKLESVNKNFQLSMDLLSAEDYIYQNFLINVI